MRRLYIDTNIARKDLPFRLECELEKDIIYESQVRCVLKSGREISGIITRVQTRKSHHIPRSFLELSLEFAQEPVRIHLIEVNKMFAPDGNSLILVYERNRSFYRE